MPLVIAVHLITLFCWVPAHTTKAYCASAIALSLKCRCYALFITGSLETQRYSYLIGYRLRGISSIFALCTGFTRWGCNMASSSASLKRKRRGPYLQYLQAPNPLTAMPRSTRFRYLCGITRQSRKLSTLTIIVLAIILLHTRFRISR